MNPFRLELTSSVKIAAQKNHVWGVFSEILRWPDWCEVCAAANAGQEFDWTIGQRIGLRLRLAGIGVPFNVAVTESEPGVSVAWTSTKFTVTAVRTFSFEDSEDGTLVTDHKLFTSPVLPLSLFYPRPIIRRMADSMLADLKAECEATV